LRKTFLAPAKINLCLHVLGKRADGYHELRMLMQRVSLYDRIHISLEPGLGVDVYCEALTLPDGVPNIAGRAAHRMLERCPSDFRVRVEIEKSIPAAAGLGGGSSNAATVLLALNEMLGLNLSRDELRKEALPLGADVPFFVFERAAWAEGVGEKLSAAGQMPDFYYLLVNPGIEVSTAWVFQNLGLTTSNRPVNLPAFDTGAASILRGLHNDLEPVTFAKYPVVAEVKSVLNESGAIGALMSGSGATVFGVFEDQGAAEAARAALSGRGWWTAVARPV